MGTHNRIINNPHAEKPEKIQRIEVYKGSGGALSTPITQKHVKHVPCGVLHPQV